MLREDDIESYIETNKHSFVLGDGPAGTRYAFFVRDPVDRWVSGFLSRLRQGCPNYPHVGHRDALIAFYDFPTPDSLARALSTEKGQRANAAILHTRRSFSSYLEKIEKHVHDIAFVGRMNKMTSDYNDMLKHIIPHWNKTRSEGSHAHSNPKSFEGLTHLSPVGRCSLERHLERDYAIMDILYDAGLISEKFPRSCSKNDLTISSTHKRTKGLPLKWFDDHWRTSMKSAQDAWRLRSMEKKHQDRAKKRRLRKEHFKKQCEVLYTALRALPNP